MFLIIYLYKLCLQLNTTWMDRVLFLTASKTVSAFLSRNGVLVALNKPRTPFWTVFIGTTFYHRNGPEASRGFICFGVIWMNQLSAAVWPISHLRKLILVDNTERTLARTRSNKSSKTHRTTTAVSTSILSLHSEVV